MSGDLHDLCTWHAHLTPWLVTEFVWDEQTRLPSRLVWATPTHPACVFTITAGRLRPGCWWITERSLGERHALTIDVRVAGLSMTAMRQLIALRMAMLTALAHARAIEQR